MDVFVLRGAVSAYSFSYRLLIPTKSRLGDPVYNCLGRLIGVDESSIISSQCATQPAVRAMANITVNISTGIFKAL
jgi:hypothetical protein